MAIALSFIKTTRNGLLLTIYVHPKSKSNMDINEDYIELWVKAPAEKGKANKEVIKRLAETFKLSTKKIQIIKGLKTRRKLIFIESPNPMKLKYRITKMYSNLPASKSN